MRNSLLKFFGYLLYLALCIIAVDYAFYRVYLHQVLPAGWSSWENPAEVMQNDKDSTPKDFIKSKPAGVVRIGCFGDSFTHGAEVNEHSDYPSLLRKLLVRKGFGNVEVINFGMTGGGFHSVFDLWKYFAPQYALDYIIIGPSCFQTDRDATFSSGLNYPVKSALEHFHPRYILTGQGMEEILLAGRGRDDRLAAYTRFIPPLRYLRYDLRAPAFLAAPLHILVPGRSLKNPFYYRRDIESEMDEIHSLQLGEIASHTPQMIVFNIDPRIVRLTAALRRKNIAYFAVKYQEHVVFPFVAIGGHMSPGGNLFLARLLASSLAGARESRQSVLEFIPLPPPTAAKGRDQESSTRRLSSYRDVHIEVAGSPMGRFFNSAVNAEQYCVGPSCRSEVDVFNDAVSLIGFGAAGKSLLDRPFLALDFPLRPGMRIVNKMYFRGRLISERANGRINLLRAGFPVGWAEAEMIDKWIHHPHPTWLDLQIDGEFDAMEICIDGKTVFSGKRLGKSGIVRMLPSSGSALLFIKADGRVPFNPDATPTAGLAYLCLQDAARKNCAPIAVFKKREQIFPVVGVSKPLTAFGSSGPRNSQLNSH